MQDIAQMLLMAAGGDGGVASRSYNTARGYNSTGLTSFSETAVSIGTAAASRIVIVALTTLDTATYTARTTDTVTIGGISATKLITRVYNSSTAVDLWMAEVPTGTTATIAFTTSGNVNQYELLSLSVYGAVPTPYATAGTTSGTSLSVSAPRNGVVVGFASWTNAAVGGVTPDATVNNGANVACALGSLVPTATGSQSVTNGSTTGIVAVSFAPI